MFGTNIELRNNEKMFISGAANKKQKIGSKGGTLYLTNQRLVFRAHALNFGSKVDDYSLAQIMMNGNTVNLKTSNLGISCDMTFETKSGANLGFIVSKKQKDDWIYYITEAVKEYACSRITIPEEVSDFQVEEVKETIKKQIRVEHCRGCGAFVILNGQDVVKCDYCGRPTV